MEKSASDEPLRGWTIPRHAAPALLAVSFLAYAIGGFTGIELCDRMAAPPCRMIRDTLEWVGAAFPFGFVFLCLAMFRGLGLIGILSINALLGLGLAFLLWRLLPPRLTIKQFAALIASWVALSVVTFPLGVLIMVWIGRRIYEG